MQLAREGYWKKKVVMWTGSRCNCGCGFNNSDINSFPGKSFLARHQLLERQNQFERKTNYEESATGVGGDVTFIYH
jgi:hypothetical protein